MAKSGITSTKKGMKVGMNSGMNRIVVIALLMLFSSLILSVSAVFAYDITGTVVGSGVGQLSGATIDLTNLSSGTLVGTTTTNSTGAYAFTVPNVQAAYRFDASAPGFVSQSKSTLVNANKIVDITLGPQASVIVSGTVVDDSGLPLEDVAITATLNGAVIDVVETDVTGSFSVTVYDNATYTVTFTLPSYNSVTETVVVSGNTPIADDVVLGDAPTTGTLTGSITDSTIIAIDNVEVSLLRGSSVVAITSTSAAGDYSFIVPGRTYTIVASKQGYKEATRDVTFANGETKEENIQLLAADNPAVDNDGDGDAAPPQGSDCDDVNSNIASTHIEVENNGVDDDCNAGTSDTPSVVTVANEGGGSSGSGGGGGGGGRSGASRVLDEATIQEGLYLVKLRRNDRVHFTYKDNKYFMTAATVHNNLVVLRLFPVPTQDFRFLVGQTVRVDVDHDGTDDYHYTLIESRTGQATFHVRDLSVKTAPKRQGRGVIVVEDEFGTPRPDAVQVVKTTSVKEGSLDIVPQEISGHRISPFVGGGLAAAILVIGLIVYFVVRKRK